MNINDIEMFEIEISSDCNAACPMCSREMFKDHLVSRNITYNQFTDAFTPKILNGKIVEFSGVWGDAIKNPECLEIIEYIVSNNCRVWMDTNGGYQTKKWWANLGKVSKKYNNRIQIRWAIDGHKETNHIYRKNTKFDIIERNMTAYLKESEAPDNHNIWSFIPFEHNLYELETAKEHANELGLRFQIRQSSRDPVKTTVRIDKNTEKEVLIKTVIFENNKTSKSIKDCRFYHNKWIFIGSDFKVWPCCFIWDEVSRNRKNILEKFKDFHPNWNDLRHHTLESILNHKYYQNTLMDSWDSNHPMHLDRCVRTCLKDKRNKILSE